MGTRHKNRHMHPHAIDELKPQFAMLHRVQRSHAQFFLGFPHRAFEGGFAWIYLPAWTIDFACTEASLLANQEHLAAWFIDHEHQSRASAGVPSAPIGNQYVSHFR